MPPYPPNLSYFLSTYIYIHPKQQRMRVWTEGELVVGEAGGSYTYVTVSNGNEDRVYVPSALTCNVHRCGSNPSEYYALSRANRGLNPRLKKQPGSAGVRIVWIQEWGFAVRMKYRMERSITQSTEDRDRYKWGICLCADTANIRDLHKGKLVFQAEFKRV